jgi:hypothetical protein
VSDPDRCRVMLIGGPHHEVILDDQGTESPGITIVMLRFAEDGPMVNDLYQWTQDVLPSGLHLAVFTGTRPDPGTGRPSGDPVAPVARRITMQPDQADHLPPSETTATYLGLIPGLGCMYAGRDAAAAVWFASVVALEGLTLWLAFPKGGLTGFGVVVVLFLQLVTFIIWGGSIVAGRKHVRAANQS